MKNFKYLLEQMELFEASRSIVKVKQCLGRLYLDEIRHVVLESVFIRFQSVFTLEL